MSYISVKNLIVDFIQGTDEEREISVRALNGVSLDIEKGSFVSIVGMNGSGKSTLAKCFNGLIKPNEGDILVDGISINDDEKLWEIRKKIAMVFQNPDNQIVSTIVEDDVAFGPENIGINPIQIRKRVDAALKKVDMFDNRTKGAHMLSGGQKQRIAIAGAVAMMPECIIFDEPTAMLDPKGRMQVLKIIKDLNKDGITCILITHFMEEVLQSDRMIVLKDGAIISDSKPNDFFKNSKLIKDSGLDMPPFIELLSKLKKSGIKITDDVRTVNELICQLK